jgi:ParB-like chromosome segregation protein Spo0J
LPVTLPETIVRRRCAALIPYARNARTHSDQQVAQIAASIREFGFTNPVLIDEEDGIIAGNGRVLAAHLLGLDEVPCIVLAHLTPDLDSRTGFRHREWQKCWRLIKPDQKCGAKL